MKIYTRTGDDGSTGLFGGRRVAKCSPRVEVYGTVDELNSSLGVAAAHASAESRLAEADAARLGEFLAHLQAELFVLGADLATPRDGKAKALIARVEPDAIAALEAAIDRYEADLEPLQTFILPGGALLGAELHRARTVARRAERALVAASDSDEDFGPVALRYLNRLSDLLFVLARWANHACGCAETAWSPR